MKGYVSLIVFSRLQSTDPTDVNAAKRMQGYSPDIFQGIPCYTICPDYSSL